MAGILDCDEIKFIRANRPCLGYFLSLLQLVSRLGLCGAVYPIRERCCGPALAIRLTNSVSDPMRRNKARSHGCGAFLFSVRLIPASTMPAAPLRTCPRCPAPRYRPARAGCAAVLINASCSSVLASKSLVYLARLSADLLFLFG